MNCQVLEQSSTAKPSRPRSALQQVPPPPASAARSRWTTSPGPAPSTTAPADGIPASQQSPASTARADHHLRPTPTKNTARRITHNRRRARSSSPIRNNSINDAKTMRYRRSDQTSAHQPQARRPDRDPRQQIAQHAGPGPNRRVQRHRNGGGPQQGNQTGQHQ